MSSPKDGDTSSRSNKRNFDSSSRSRSGDRGGGFDSSNRSRSDNRTFDSSNRSKSGDRGGFDSSNRSSDSFDASSGGGAAPPRKMPSKSGSKFISNRNNCDFKWQRARGVVGALEVNCEPDFNYRDELVPRYTTNREAVFDDALKCWKELKLRDSFVKACDSLPVSTCCCGLLGDSDATIRDFIPLLNEGWVKNANKQLLERGVKVDIFLWNWQNASGKAETNIMLIRFFELSSYRLRRASRDESLEFDDLMSAEELSKVMEADEDEPADGAVAKKEMAR